MHRRSIVLALASIVCSAASLVQASTPVEVAAIERVLQAFTEAWNRHDARQFSEVFTEDAEFTNVAGVSAVGRQAIEQFHAPRFAGHFKDSSQVITRSKIKFIRPDVAAVDAWWEMTGARTAAGQDAGFRRGVLSLVMVKGEQGWLIAVMHNANLAAPASVLPP